MPYISLAGQTFGRLLVLRLYTGPKSRKGSFWVCACSCGAEKIIAADTLKMGTKSCGCWAREKSSRIHTKHGMEATPTYKSWSSMKERCSNINAPNYRNYGGRGISYCQEWGSFESFFRDMGKRPSGHTLGRINNNGNYCLENCRWETPKQQQRNKTNTKLNTQLLVEIRERYKEGEGKTAIARTLGRQRHNVRDALSGKCWL